MFNRFLIIFTMLFVTSTQSLSQEVPSGLNLSNEPISIKSEKLDEFGRLGDCDFSSRTDNLLFSLQEKPDHHAYIIAYNGTGVLPAEYDRYPFEGMITNQINFRRFDGSRITFIRGGFRTEPKVEFWIAPPGAEMPQPSDTISKPDIPTNKTFLFDKSLMVSEYSDDPAAEFILPAVKAEEELLMTESTGETQPDDSEETAIIETEADISEARTPKEVEDERFQWVSGKFGDLLKTRELQGGVMIFYADDSRYDISKLQQFAYSGKQRLANASGIEPDRIKIVFGGYRGIPEVEFWIVPKDGVAPTLKPEERPVEDLEN